LVESNLMAEKDLKFGERLHDAIVRSGLAKKTVAERAQITPSTLSVYINEGRIPEAPILLALSQVLKTTMEDLLAGTETRDSEAVRSAEQGELVDQFVYVPQVSGRISAGGGMEPDNRLGARIAFRKDWITRKGNPSKMSLIRVSGDSMEDTLFSGDIVLVDHSRAYLDPQGGIYALSINNDVMIKRLERIPGTDLVKIISDNKRYDPSEMNAIDIRINGKVIWFGRELERE
jgi:phage repressor protein C with HTH and peptisase S24 domain